MAGHSKWANIKHRKTKQDAAKGKIFTKLIREITVAAKQSQDISANSRLRLAVDKALSQNMTRDTIDRAIKRGAGDENDAKMEDILYEGYAHGGVAILVQCLSDNRNRTAGEVRHMFSKHGGNLGTSGSVAYLFKQSGIICFPPESNEDKIMQVALDAGAEDVINNSDGSVEVITTLENFAKVKDAMESSGLEPVEAEISMLASIQVALDKEASIKVMGLIDALEGLDDVQNVYSNADISEEFYEE
ncbi:MAG: YebC/PmpR family DNA-binding transcriptional regulator [Gammaproteobacteria bacterium]|nr:YebC/PmpR family DNA-binding transcriptional regulator [Gammaproteobacteria bacterium]